MSADSTSQSGGLNLHMVARLPEGSRARLKGVCVEANLWLPNGSPQRVPASGANDLRASSRAQVAQFVALATSGTKRALPCYLLGRRFRLCFVARNTPACGSSASGLSEGNLIQVHDLRIPPSFRLQFRHNNQGGCLH